MLHFYSDVTSRYLVEGPKGAVLHTGDFRAEPWFLESLIKNPYIQRYLAAPSATKQNRGTSTDISRTLETIYLDTACMFSTSNVPTKVGRTILLALHNTYRMTCRMTRSPA